MPTRRAFLGHVFLAAGAGAGAVGAATRNVEAAARINVDLAAHPGTAEDLEGDEAFWAEAGRAFTVDRSIVNLNNGGVSPAIGAAQASMKRHLDFSHQCPAHNMWNVLEPRREDVRKGLASQWGVAAGEIAITRNASESLQICQFGMDLRKGDEVLTTTQDYPRMIHTYQQRSRREGIRLTQIGIPVPAEDDAEIVRRFERAITDRTRVILMCHMVNLTGQILPVRAVVAMARRRGIPVIVDGAHALAHFDFSLGDLECDYYGTSLHKWLFAPHGTGLLYVRREKIGDLWPLMAAPESNGDDIRKFEQIGTHPAANTLAIAESLDFHRALGPRRKEARLIFLRDYWARRLSEHPRTRLHTSLQPGRACGIANVAVDGIAPGAIADRLWREHRILVAGIGHPECPGVRVSPSVYTTRQELDRFCDAMMKIIGRS
ncbi:MAG: aminotransferase V [Phycisphaeraceae bacterium]|nr:aminotransferase V [Phycisphaeraceae bacterium]